jgi:hypothetical protein
MPAPGLVKPFAAVSRLLCWRSPSAVIGAIGAIIVDTVKGVTWRWFQPHILKERGEVVTPSLAHNYPSSSVGRVVSVARIVAATFRGSPTTIFWRVVSTVTALRCSRPLSVQTAAALRQPFSEAAGLCDLATTAVADALPHGMRVAVPPHGANHEQSAKSLSGHVWERNRHYTNYIQQYRNSLRTSYACSWAR